MEANMEWRNKRRRSESVSSDSTQEEGSMRSRTPSPEPAQPAKFHRGESPPKELLCTLPPTCSQPGKAQSFATQAELDAHQASLHRWICRVPIKDKPDRVGEGQVVFVPEQFSGRSTMGHGNNWRECGKVFPDERLLDLHYTETHDPIARERKDRGEKIFGCFLPEGQCDKVFLSPKKRRWHLINEHHYPQGYFFSVTNHGINQITRAEGPAASLIRPRRDPPPPEETKSKAPPPPRRPPDDMMSIDDLTTKMESLESSLMFVPSGVRKARAHRAMKFG